MTHQCQQCKIQKESAKMPRGWKKHDAATICGKCWRQLYVLRAISIPVVRPLGIGWPELRESLNRAWAMATAAVNIAMSETFSRDDKRTPASEKIGKKPKTYCYPQVRENVPDLPSQSAASITNTVEAKYRAKRYEVIWTGASSLPSARYPQPYPIPGAAWKASYDTAGKESGDLIPCVSVPLPGGRQTLQLRGGREFARQLKDFALIVSGEAVQGEMQILRQKVNSGDHRNGGSARDSGGQKFATRVIVKLVAWFPRSAGKQRSGTLFVRTDSDCFCVALDDKQNKIRTWNADHVRRWVVEHSRRIQRLSDDQKAEQRPLAKFQSRREIHVDKFRDRIDSFIKETAAQIAGVADRMKFEKVVWDDSDKSYLDKFDWSGFKSRLQTKLDSLGIVFELASGAVGEELPDVLAEENED